MKWDKKEHSAHKTDHFLFNQLIPYIGNKRKLLDLIKLSIEQTNTVPEKTIFIDCFAGTGVVSRLAKIMGYQIICNDWEPYSESLNIATIQNQHPLTYFNNQSYQDILSYLNNLPPKQDWVTRYLCPEDDVNYNTEQDRMFYMRKNGMRIDAMREQILQWEQNDLLTPQQRACLLAPLLYCASYHSNTSGVFKGFHKGWGGQTKTALYRIMADLTLYPIQFMNNHQDNLIFRMDAHKLAGILPTITQSKNTIAYLDPPYNQHPYGSNYHVLNSITLWDKPEVSEKIIPKEKSAIRKDWRTDRKSAYTIRSQATSAYQELLRNLSTQWIATSYSTDGFIPLDEMIKVNCDIGFVQIFAKTYKRYRVSSQRYSNKAFNIEFVILTQVGKQSKQSVEELVTKIKNLENTSLTPQQEDTRSKIYLFE